MSFRFVWIFLTFIAMTPLLWSEDLGNYDQAVEYLKADQFDQAIEYFQKALTEESRPQAQARIYNLIGLAYLKQGISSVSAIGSFEQAIKLDPNFAEAYFNIASAYAANNADPEKATQYFLRTIEIDAHYYKAYFGLGWFTLMQKDDPAKAIEYFKTTVEQYPEFAEAYYGMGLAYIRTHKPHMALGAVSQLRGLKRDDLASVLEKAVTEVSPPEDSAVPAETAPTSAPAAVPAASPSETEPRKRSPFEVIMRGKVSKAS